MSFTYDYTTYDTDGTVDQGTLASSYTNALSAYLQGDGADYVAFLSYVANGSTDVDAALALKAAVEGGSFSLSGLFSAAQSKTGEVAGDDITNPTPSLTVTLADGSSMTIDLTAMLTGLDTETWTTIAKKATISHTREFYSESSEPEGYSADWAAPVQNQAPTADPIIWGVTEFDEHAEASTAEVPVTTNLLTAANATDLDGDVLSIVAGSVTLADGSDLPGYLTVDYTTGDLTIETNSADFDNLYLGSTLDLDIKYEITDGTDTISNTVDLTITGTADQFTQTTDITSSVTTFNTAWDGALNFTITDAPTGAFDFTGTATVKVVGDIDGVTQLETVTVALEGDDSAILGMTTDGNKEPGKPNYLVYTDTDTVDFASADTAVTGSFDASTANGADGVDQLTLVEVSLTEYQYWL